MWWAAGAARRPRIVANDVQVRRSTTSVSSLPVRILGGYGQARRDARRAVEQALASEEMRDRGFPAGEVSRLARAGSRCDGRWRRGFLRFCLRSRCAGSCRCARSATQLSAVLRRRRLFKPAGAALLAGKEMFARRAHRGRSASSARRMSLDPRAKDAGSNLHTRARSPVRAGRVAGEPRAVPCPLNRKLIATCAPRSRIRCVLASKPCACSARLATAADSGRHAGRGCAAVVRDRMPARAGILRYGG